MGLHNLAYRQAKLLGKVIVSGVVGWDSHDGTTAIAAQHIVSHPYGHCLLVHWVPCIAACRYTHLLVLCVLARKTKETWEGATPHVGAGERMYCGERGEEGQGQHNACNSLCI